MRPLPSRPLQRQRALRPHRVPQAVPLRRGRGRGQPLLRPVRLQAERADLRLLQAPGRQHPPRQAIQAGVPDVGHLHQHAAAKQVRLAPSKHGIMYLRYMRYNLIFI